MRQIRKILFPVDFSVSCSGVARYVECFAGQFGAEIMLVHAIEPGDHSASGRSAINDRLNGFFPNEPPILDIHRMSVPGDPAVVIAEAAESWKPDLIMMPTRGHGDFRRHLVGSVTAKVLHDVLCPVWTSIHAESALTVDSIQCRRVLCGLDLTGRSQSILQWASWFAGEFEADLGIVHAMAAVDPSLATMEVAPGLGPSIIASAYQQYMFERAHTGVDLLERQTGTHARIFIRPGQPADVVPRVASEFEADLVTIGRRSSESVAGDIFHNASAIVRESPCPVITM